MMNNVGNSTDMCRFYIADESDMVASGACYNVQIRPGDTCFVPSTSTSYMVDNSLKWVNLDTGSEV